MTTTQMELDASYGAALVQYFNETIYAPRVEDTGIRAGTRAEKWAARKLAGSDTKLLQANLSDCLRMLRQFAQFNELRFDPFQEGPEDPAVTRQRI